MEETNFESKKVSKKDLKISTWQDLCMVFQGLETKEETRRSWNEMNEEKIKHLHTNNEEKTQGLFE